MGDGSLTLTADSPEKVVAVVVDGGFVVVHIDPGEFKKISKLLAVESTQAVPQSVCVKDSAP